MDIKKNILERLETIEKQLNLPYKEISTFYLFKEKFIKKLEELQVDDLDTYLDLVDQTFNEFKTKLSYDYSFNNFNIFPTQEGKIQLRAMLDFILFLENIAFLYRANYIKGTTLSAIEDVEKLLNKWLYEYFPDDEVPEDYVYLYRWFKWFADGEKNRENKNGYEALYNIIGKMVSYFESRWGKRIVTYGAGGNFELSIDDSYIDRVRGKKHGVVGNSVNRKTMKEEYGIDSSKIALSVFSEGDATQ
jgi:hypothetical protein